MKKKVFLSYSWKDKLVASRLYDDLVRSNVSIWRDQIDGDPLADFEKEFLSQIDQCDYFIMLDSKNYRLRSQWCCEEVERCMQNRREREGGGPEIIVCLIDEDGSWRKDFSNGREVFEQVNGLKYKNLYYSGYDNDGVYDQVLNFICNQLGVTYERWDRIPIRKDMKDEILGAEKNEESTEFDETTDDIITKGYEVILDKQEKNYPNIKESFKLWLEDCQYSGRQLFFPKWTYAVWLANQPDMDAFEVFGLFKEIANQFPQDFRGFRGMGNIAAMIGNKLHDEDKTNLANDYYSKAEEALLEANRLMDDWQRKICGFEVLYNLGMICYNVSNNDKSQYYWEKALDIMLKDGFFNESLVSKYFILLKKLDVSMDKIKGWLHDLMLKYPTEPVLFQLTGLSCCENGDFNKALEMLQKAYQLNPSMENLYYLLNVKIGLGRLSPNEVREIERTLDAAPSDEEDWIVDVRNLLDKVK